MLEFPNINPIALEIGPIVVRWYSLAYIIGIVGGWWLIGKMNKVTKTFSKDQYDSLMTYGILGIILGGRLGYVLFYNLPHFMQHPEEILMVWQGGMSFHGGMLGIIAAIYIFSRVNKIVFLKVMDLIASVAPIGLCLGRLANFINGELFGRVTNSPLGMVFPHGGELPRHASQLYEAGLEGAVLFGILMLLFWKRGAWKYAGKMSGYFLIFYGAFRIFCELFREPDVQLGFFAGGVTMGQILSLPMIALGVYLVLHAKKNNQRNKK